MVQDTRANILCLCQKAWGGLMTCSHNLTFISQLKESKASIIWRALPTITGQWFKPIQRKCASPWFIIASCITVIFWRSPIQSFICWIVGSYNFRWQGWRKLYSMCQCWGSDYILCCFFTTSFQVLGVGRAGWLRCILEIETPPLNDEKWSRQKLLWKSESHYLFHTSSLHLHFVWECTGTPVNKNKPTCPWLIVLPFDLSHVSTSGSQIWWSKETAGKPATN